MKKRFVLMTETLTAEQETQLRGAIGPVHWWHWLPNAWLIIDYSESVTANSINAGFQSVAPNAQCLVLEVDHKAWASMERRMPKGVLSDWIRTNWETP